MPSSLPPLDPWQPTRRSLHAWSKVLSAVRGALCDKHPRWWHIGLAADRHGITTGTIEHGEAAGGLELRLDLQRHQLVVAAGGEAPAVLELEPAPSGSRLGAWALHRVAELLGSEPETERSKWDDGSARRYDPAAAERYRRASGCIAAVLEELRGELPGERGPVQLWAHHFDLAFEVFGSRTAEFEGRQQAAQVGFGFSPGDDANPAPYFYGTPWPFDEAMRRAPLPAGRWRSEGWKGAELPYDAALEGGGGPLVKRFLQAVWEGGRSALG